MLEVHAKREGEFKGRFHIPIQSFGEICFNSLWPPVCLIIHREHEQIGERSSPLPKTRNLYLNSPQP